MMTSIASIIQDGVKSRCLSILVFGPEVKTVSSKPRTRNLQNKRKEIRTALECLGHNVKYAEDLVDTSLVGPSANVVVQEFGIMEEYDFIVNLVDSHGSIVEATMISNKQLLAQKSSQYIDKDHEDGLVMRVLELAEVLGGHIHKFKYPEDLTECHLLTHIKSRVEKIQVLKYIG